MYNTIFSGNNGRSIDRRPAMDSSSKVVQGYLTFKHLTCCFQLHFLRQRRHVRQIHIFPVFRVKKGRQNHYNHNFGWERAVSHAKFSDENDYDD